MSTFALNPGDFASGYRSPRRRRLPLAEALFARPDAAQDTSFVPLPLVKNTAPNQLKKPIWLQSGFWVAAVVVGHFSVAWYLHTAKATSSLAPAKTVVTIEFAKPKPAEPKVEPPKPEPPKLKPQPQAKPQQQVKPVPQNAAPPVLDTHALPEVGTVAAPPPAPPVVEKAPPAPEKITDAVGKVGGLDTPAPKFPSIAIDQGWEGKVILRVRVLASGKPESVEIKQSSGRKVLDEAALKAVRAWLFTPAKRGETPVDGWATVPIEFKLSA